MAPNLTPAQHAILAHAVHHTEGKIAWFPDNIKGGARARVLTSLIRNDLIEYRGDQAAVSDAGYDALGLPRQKPVVVAAKATTSTPKPRTRDNSKQAQVIAMLKRPEGATVQQIVDLTGWQAHTVRGTFAGAFKKKLGLAITSERHEGGTRVYRITD